MENTFLLKGVNIFTRVFLKVSLIILIFLSALSVSYGNEITSEPIIEGESIVGLKIGDTEAEDKVLALLYQGLFELYYVDKSPKTNKKIINFGNMTEKKGGLLITVFLSNDRISIIQVTSVPIKGEHLYKGKTKKGFSFGDSFQVIEELYGEPYRKSLQELGGFYWYKKEGIVFMVIFSGIDMDVEKPNTIIIMPPDSDLHPYSIFNFFRR